MILSIPEQEVTGCHFVSF